MLLEKAYAKLHGCYESLLHGLMDKCLMDLTMAAHVQVVRKEIISPDGANCSKLMLCFIILLWCCE